MTTTKSLAVDGRQSWIGTHAEFVLVANEILGQILNRIDRPEMEKKNYKFLPKIVFPMNK